MKPLFTLLLLALLFSCTITKRHFGSGYHIEWKKAHAKTDNEPDPANIIDSGQEHSIRSEESKVITESIIQADSVNITEEISSNSQEVVVQEQMIVSETRSEFREEQLLKSELIIKDDPIEPKRKVEPFTWIALGCLGLAIIAAIIGFSIVAGEVPLMIALIHYFIFVVSSMISVNHIRRNPDAYKGKGLSWTLFGLSLATIVLTICITIYKVVDFFR